MKNLRKIKDLVNNKAISKNINPQILLRNYMTERLLERISISNYKNNFILKGGMLIAHLVGVGLRQTIDIDTTVKSYSVSKEKILTAFKEIISINLNDGVKFKIKKIVNIRQEEYGGLRITFESYLETARIPIAVDITTDDKITPHEIEYQYNLLFEERTINILAYNVETIIAEKYETIVSRGIANTRMRDFYDIYILYLTQNINDELLKKAIINTAVKRNSIHLLENKEMILKQVFNDETMLNLWNNYQKKYNYAKEITWFQIKKTVLNI